MGEGLENRFRYFAKDHHRLTALLDAVKTKRYTYTRLQRAVLGVILGITPKDMAAYNNQKRMMAYEIKNPAGMASHNIEAGPAYIRVLGFKRKSTQLLGEMTRQASLPVLTTGKAMDQLKEPEASMLSKEFEAGDIYRMAFGGDCGYRHERGMPVVMI